MEGIIFYSTLNKGPPVPSRKVIWLLLDKKLSGRSEVALTKKES
jgi:hypothetical protein